MTDPKLPADQGDTTTPDDVATLYSWANLHGAKYRDFSASRAQAREEARLRFEEVQAAERRRLEEEAERVRQEEAQLAARKAAEAAEAARQAEAERLAEIARQAEAERQAVLAAQEAQRLAVQQRGWQPPPVDVFEAGYAAPANPDPDVVFVEPVALFEAPPAAYPAQAHDFAEDFSGNSEAAPVDPWIAEAPIPAPLSPPWQRTASPPVANGQPLHPIIAQHTPQTAPQAIPPIRGAATPPAPARPAAFQPSAPHQHAPGAYEPSPSQQDPYASAPWLQPESREQMSRPAWLAPELPIAPVPDAPQYRVPPAPPVAASAGSPASPVQQQYGQIYGQVPSHREVPPVPAAAPRSTQSPISGSGSGSSQYSSHQTARQPGYFSGPATPAQPPATTPSMIHAPVASAPQPHNLPPNQPNNPVDDTLLGSREQITSRWFALKNVFDPNAAPAEQVPQQPPARVPMLAVFSLAGGVGKTSLVASLGRALSSRGERVLLVDTAVYGLLPFFFGARDQRPGMLRTFNPPGVGVDAPIQLVTLDPENPTTEEHAQIPLRNSDSAQDWLAQEIGRYTRGANRVLVDLPTASGSTTRRVLRMNPTVLVPILPDMNSVVSVGAIESFFRNSSSVLPPGGKPIMPYYVLNQFDYSLPLHLDVREILRDQIGDRLLPFALRRSPAVSEALAEGMTVIDYAPSAVVAEDYAQLAEWVRSLSAPAMQSYRGVRWSER